jgi:hypothetical protein
MAKRTKKETAYITQDLLDWMEEQLQETKEVPSVEDMDAWVTTGYIYFFKPVELKELRDLFIKMMEDEAND